MNTDKQLLQECILFEYDRKQLNESVSHDGPLIVKGVVQRAGEKNQNGREYPVSVLKNEVENYTKNFIKERRALGELDHPASEVVNLKNVSHNILELHWEGDDLVGTIEVLSTPSGNILRELFKSNIRVGISSRALGSVKTNNQGIQVVQDDLSIVCWDIVSNPSTRGAFVSPSALNENVNSQIINPFEKADQLIHNILTELNQ